MGFFDKLKQGLGKTKSNINEKFNNVFSTFRKVDEDLLEELEETLIMSDIGMETSVEIIDKLRQKIRKENIKNAEEVKEALKQIIQEIMDENDNPKLIVSKNGINEIVTQTENTYIFFDCATNKAELYIVENEKIEFNDKVNIIYYNLVLAHERRFIMCYLI